jgi:predicted kinase
MFNPNLLKTLKSPFVIIMVGPPLVGKSTAIKTWLNKYDGEVNIISRDAIVLEQHGSDDYTAAFNSVNQKEVDRILISRIEKANKNRQNSIIDMTNLTSKRRGYNLSFFDDSYYKVAVVFPMLTAQEFKVRNEKRTIEENKYIPEHVIRNMIDSFQPIKDSEGFNKIISL